MRWLALALLAAAAPGCALDYDGLSGGCVAGCDAGCVGSGCSGADACAGTAGPLPVRVALSDRSFCIDSTEVTNAQYAQFLAAKGADTSGQPEICSWNTSYEPLDWSAADDAELPVTKVDWCDAYAFCRWAGKELCGSIEGGAHSPEQMNDPTVSAWFAACSRGGERTFPYGASYQAGACVDGSIDHLAHAKSLASCEGGYQGLFDLSGNVEEWVDACDATSGRDDGCLARGGNFSDGEQRLRCESTSDDLQPRNVREAWRGFRCCSR